MTLKGPLVESSGSDFQTILDNFLYVVDQSSLKSTTTDDLIQFRDSSKVNVKDDFVRLFGSGQLITGGNLLELDDGSTVTIEDGRFINASSNSLVLIPGAGLESVGDDTTINITNHIPFFIFYDKRIILWTQLASIFN